MSKYQAMPDAELLSEWETEMDFTNRKAILKAMKKKLKRVSKLCIGRLWV